LGNEIATVRISEFFIVMLQCDNSWWNKGTKRNADEKIMMIIFFRLRSFLVHRQYKLKFLSVQQH